mgnify:CR=1 FL=1
MRRHRDVLAAGPRHDAGHLRDVFDAVGERRGRDDEVIPFEYGERLAASTDARVAVLVQGRSHLIAIVAELARRGIELVRKGS